jgi:hypothetical protein
MLRAASAEPMMRFALGRCRNCEEPVSSFARACPACGAPNLPNPVVIATALAAVALVGGAIALGVHVMRGSRTPPEAASSGAPAPTAGDTKTESASDYGWIVTAMAECEEEAKIQPDTMHFLIVPLRTSGMSLPGWSPEPISRVGEHAVLLNSTDALIGLRNRALLLYQKPMTFAVSDPETSTVYKWKPATGVTALKARNTGSTKLTLGFEIPDLAKDLAWGPTINLKKGTCYWINPLVRHTPRSG